MVTMNPENVKRLLADGLAKAAAKKRLKFSAAQFEAKAVQMIDHASCHEAAHAVVAIKQGLPIASIELVFWSNEDFGGFTRSDYDEIKPPIFTRSQWCQKIIVLLAGPAYDELTNEPDRETIDGDPQDAASDLALARAYAQKVHIHRSKLEAFYWSTAKLLVERHFKLIRHIGRELARSKNVMLGGYHIAQAIKAFERGKKR